MPSGTHWQPDKISLSQHCSRMIWQNGLSVVCAECQNATTYLENAPDFLESADRDGFQYEAGLFRRVEAKLERWMD